MVEAADGSCWVVKATSNPQHRRILVNEWIAGSFLRYLQIRSPEAAVIDLPASLVEAEPRLCIELGRRQVRIPAGWHFGSRYPGDPDRTAVYDFLPDALLANVSNLGDFAGTFVFDKWVCNSDARQCIFYRAERREPASQESPALVRPGFVASMIDHGFVFDGPNWRFGDAPRFGLYISPRVYSGIRGWDDLEPWLSRIEHFPEEQADLALRGIPPEWIAGDEPAIEETLSRLFDRRRRVRAIVEDAIAQLGGKWFPAWR